MSFRHRRHLLLSIATVLMPLLAACGGSQFAQGGATPSAILRSSHVLQASIPNLFARAVGKPLSQSDIDNYIDPSVQGADRKTIRNLMAMMPANMRGDVTYYDGARVISNNPAILPYIKVQTGTMDLRKRSQRENSLPMRRWRTAGFCSPPDPHPGTGPYVREVGNCGFPSGWGIVNLECNSTHFYSNTDLFPNYQDNKEGGYMYYELTNANTGASPALSEGGIFTQYGVYGEGDIDPYITSNLGTLQNVNARFTCGTYIGVMSGLELAAPGSQPYYYVATGTIPNYTPANAWQSTETVTMSNAAWIFEPAPGNISMYDWGTNSVGLQTPCMHCSVSKITSIADQGGNDIWDNSYFGVDQTYGTNAVYWPEIVFGVWTGCASGGTSPPTGCTLKYSPDSTKWYAGQEVYPQPIGNAAPDAQSSFVQANGGWVYQSYDSVTAAPPSSGPGLLRLPSGRFAAPTPGPLCAADSYGLCGVETATVDTSCSIWTYNAQGKIWYWKAITLPAKREYAVYRSTSLQSLAENDETYKQYGCNLESSTWTPAEPRITYNDPNLP